MTTFHIITIFPSMFDSYLKESILARAIKNKKIAFKFYSPRDFTKDKHKKIDARSYGGGPGMVMQVEPIIRAVKKASGKNKKNIKIILFSPSGKKFTNDYAKKISNKYKDVILIAGRYEGIDARVKKILKSEDISLGDYVLTGGELPAMVFADVLSRQIEGVLGKSESIEENRVSISEVYTRPEVVIYNEKKYRVPKVLLSGHHKKIEEYKRAQNVKRKKKK